MLARKPLQDWARRSEIGRTGTILFGIRMTIATTVHRQREAALRTIKRAGVCSLLLHCTLVAGLGISSGLRGQVAPLTDVVAEASLQFSFSEPEPTPPPEVVPDPQPEKPAETPPVEEPKEATQPARDNVFGKLVESLPPAPTEPVPLSEPTTDISKWVEAPAPPPPEPRDDPVASFAGVEARPARRIVYLIDGSGSMAASLTFVKNELTSSVARLSTEQSFQVVVYRQPAGGAGSPLNYFFYNGAGEPDFTEATLTEKQRLRSWLSDISPSGRSEPLLGLEAALRIQPDLVFVLTRNIARSGGIDVGSRNRQILDTLERINPKQLLGGRLAKIKTIQFLEDDPTGLMQSIAAEHGDGGYRLVTRSEVASRDR
jgi:hypothetical protein